MIEEIEVLKTEYRGFVASGITGIYQLRLLLPPFSRCAHVEKHSSGNISKMCKSWS